MVKGVDDRMDLKAMVSKSANVNAWLSRVGVVALFAMMTLTVVDVAGRYLFNAPLLGAYELTEFLVLILIYAFLGYTQSKKRHVCVEIVMDSAPKRISRIVALVNHLLCLGLFMLMAYMGLKKALDLFQVGEVSPNLVIPNYPFVLFLVLGSLAMCIEYVRDIVGLLSGRKEDPT